MLVIIFLANKYLLSFYKTNKKLLAAGQSFQIHLLIHVLLNVLILICVLIIATQLKIVKQLLVYDALIMANISCSLTK